MPGFYALGLTDARASARQRVFLNGHDWVSSALSRANPRLAFRYGSAIGRMAGRLGLYGAKSDEVAALFGPMSPQRSSEIAKSINGQTWMTRAATRMMDRVGYDAFSRNIVTGCDDELRRLHDERQPTVLAFMHTGPIEAIATTLHRLRIPALIIAWTWRYSWPTALDVYRIGAQAGANRWPFKRVVDKLREGGIVVLSIDTPSTSRVDVRMFGRVFTFAQGPFAAVRLSGALLRPITASWLTSGQIEISLAESLCSPCQPSRLSTYTKEDSEAMDQALADKAAAWFEDYYRKHPERFSIGLLRSLCSRAE